MEFVIQGRRTYKGQDINVVSEAHDTMSTNRRPWPGVPGDKGESPKHENPGSDVARRCRTRCRSGKKI